MDSAKDRLLEAILAFDGVPIVFALSKITRIKRGDISTLIKENPELAVAMEERGRAFFASLSDEEFLMRLHKNPDRRNGAQALVGNLPEYINVLREERLARILLAKIQTSEGPVTYEWVAAQVGLSVSVIQNPMTKNETLRLAKERKTAEYIRTCSDYDFLRFWSESRAVQLEGESKEAFDKRAEELVLKAINECDDLPTTQKIAENLPTSTRQGHIDRNAVDGILSASDVLKQAKEKREIEIITTISESELAERLEHWPTHSLSEKVRAVLEQRIEQIIVDAINKIDGVPTGGKILDCGVIKSGTVYNRLSNPNISAAMELRGREFLASKSDSELAVLVSEPGWLVNLPKYARDIVESRIAKMILDTITTFNGSPLFEDLARIVGIGVNSIIVRIRDNPTLWSAYYTKKGLTEDQALELALEREEEGAGIQEVMQRRLRNLFAFREMVGVIRCFGDLLLGKILGISLYPDPLSKAAQELEVQLDVAHQPMRPFRKGEDVSLSQANVVVVQGLHRLSSEAITTLFQKIYGAIGEGSAVITTHSPKYARLESFPDAILRNGFSVLETGVMQISLPGDKETILSYGVAPTEVDRLIRKFEGESEVIVFTKTNRTEQVTIPALVKLSGGQEDKPLDKKAEEIDVPGGINREINARFLDRSEGVAILPSAPFLVEVLDDASNRVVALLAYGMNPNHPKLPESAVYQNALGHNFREESRKLARNAERRKAIGVKPGEISTVKLSRLKQCA